MSNIYDQHRAAFHAVSAYAILDAAGKHVANVAFKYPRDGAGRLYAYVHVIGSEMARGYAGGGGYDKASAAVHSALSRIKTKRDDYTFTPTPEAMDTLQRLRAAVTDRGTSWNREIEDAGFRVLNVITG